MATALLSLGACSDKPAAPAPAAQRTPSATPPADNVFSGQLKALDKAKGVGETVEQGAARERQAIQQQAQ